MLATQSRSPRQVRNIIVENVVVSTHHYNR